MVVANSVNWSERYGERHRQHRINEFPTGIDPPRKVRIYRRGEHYVLQAWDPSRRATMSDRVDGDLLAALMRAREIDERIVNYRRSGISRGRANHHELVERYLADLAKRADAQEVSPKTVARYTSALSHYSGYVDSAGSRASRSVHEVDRDFQLGLAAYLQTLHVSPNGHPHSATRPLVNSGFILDVVRGMYRWAADPQRGGILADGFINPFTSQASRRRAQRDLFGEPAITQTMAAEFLTACDDWQRPIFAALLLWGLRPSELGWIFRESCSDGLVVIRSLPELEYLTKGRQDKRVPVVLELSGALVPDDESLTTGLLFRRRGTELSTSRSLDDLVVEFRKLTRGFTGAAERQRVRHQLQRDAGGVDYDTLEREFHAVARTLNWPRTATLKGFRHLFATSLENAGMPEFYRKYLMGQATGRSAIVTYTHLNKMRELYDGAIGTELPDVLAVLQGSRGDSRTCTSGRQRGRRAG